MENKKIHILGICGTFMGGLALLAREAGYQVTGCDQNIYPPMSDHLKEQGINIIKGYSVSDLPEADIYLVGNALSRDNEALEYLLNNKSNLRSGPEWLYDAILRTKRVIAVSGTHGKTTTTAMIAWIFEKYGKEIGYLIAGKPGNFEISSRLGSDDIFVIEADEYDTAFFDKRAKFMHYHPEVLIINNLEFDHADIYADLSEIKKQFHHLVRTLPGEATIIYPNNDKNIKEVLEMGCWSNKINFDSDVSEENYYKEKSNDFSKTELSIKGQRGILDWSMHGEHNVKNAMSALIAANHFGISSIAAIEGLKEFLGVARRQQLVFSNDKVILMDDFAHHPTAIEVTLNGLRSKYKDYRIIALVELRSNTTKSGLHDHKLEDATRNADIVYWGGVSEPQLHSLKSNSSKEIKIIKDSNETVSQILSELEPNDLIITMSNGGFDGINKLLLDGIVSEYA